MNKGEIQTNRPKDREIDNHAQSDTTERCHRQTLRVKKRTRKRTCQSLGYVERETVNHISECGKLAQKKRKHGMTGKERWFSGNCWRDSNFIIITNAQTNLCVLENETHKFSWNFEIQTDHLIPAWISDQVFIKKEGKKCYRVDFTVPTNNSVKIKQKRKKWQIRFGSCQRAEKAVEQENDGDTDCSWNTWNDSKNLRKETGGP